MSIFPPASKGGVAPDTTGVCNAYIPTNPVTGDGPYYIAPDCSTYLTDCQVNAFTSELLAATDRLGCSWNVTLTDNLGRCLQTRFTDLQTQIDGLRIRIDALEAGAGTGGISHAVSDGQYYASRDGAWEAFTPGITQAPANGSWYASRNGVWQAFDPGGGGISEAPTDGLLYGRRNGAWQVIVSGGGGQPDGSPDGSTLSGLQFDGSTGASFNVTSGSCRADDGSVANNGTSVIFLPTQSNVGIASVLDVGSVSINTWYHCFAIANVDFNSSRLLVSTSATNPTMPSGYFRKRRIFSFYTDGTGAIRPMTQRGDTFLWNTPILDANGVYFESSLLLTISIPPVLVTALVTPRAAGNPGPWRFYSPLLDEFTYSGATENIQDVWHTAGAGSTTPLQIVTGNRQIRIRHWSTPSYGGTLAVFNTTGWIDRRGQDDIPLVEDLPLAGGTMAGALVLAHDPVNAMDAATKQYVDVLLTLINNLTARVAALEGP